jgi:transcription initiation factor TFIIIB Brf1 subunit/transcription initiation factor TFIIB
MKNKNKCHLDVDFEKCIYVDYSLFSVEVGIEIEQDPNLLLMETIDNKNKDKESISNVNDNKSIVNLTLPININNEINIWQLLNKIQTDTLFEASGKGIENDITESDTVSDSTSSLTNSKKDNRCDYCNEFNALVEDISKGIVVCHNCGKVDDIILDYNPEWKQYNSEDGKTDSGNRCGYINNAFMPISSMGTNIAGPSYNRLKMIQRWNSMAYKERSLNQVLEYIDDTCTSHSIQKNIIDSAKHLYKKVLDCKHLKGPSKGKNVIIRGINRQSLIAACVKKACDENKNPRNNKEMAEIFDCDVRRITRGTKQLENLLRDSNQNELFDIEPDITPNHYITRYGSKLSLAKNHIEMSLQIANNCERMKLTNDYSAESVAAVCIIIMGEFKKICIDKKDICKIFKISDVTICKIYKKINIYKNILIDDDATEHMVKAFNL